MNEPFNSRNVEALHARLQAHMREFCKKENLEWMGSNLRFTDTAFECKVSIKQVGGLSLKEKRMTMGAANDRNGKFYEAKDIVKTRDGQNWEVWGFRGKKVIIVDTKGNRFTSLASDVELVVKQPLPKP